MLNKPYSAYTAEEFALDDLFVRWVQHPDDEEVDAYWESWLSKHPQRARIVEIAREIILTGSRPSKFPLSSDEITSVWDRIRESLQTIDEVRPLQPNVRAFVGWWYFARTIAALMGVILLISWSLWMQYGPNQCISKVSTLTNQTHRIKLPDNSAMTLYPNSSAQYARHWDDESPRAVWLTGEADFDIAPRNDTSSSRLFRVHIGNLTVEAIGTTFQIRQSSNGTCVTLTSGQLNLLLNPQRAIRLRPGDAIEVATTGMVRSLP